MAAESLKVQWDSITKALETRVESTIIDKLESAAFVAIKEVANTKDFFDVTGNLLDSIAIGIYRKGECVKCVTYADAHRKSPTRATLEEGEAYDLPNYWNGIRVKGKPYVGEFGSGKESAIIAAREAVYSHHPKAPYSIVIVAGVEYAQFVEKVKKHNVLSGLRDEIPYIFIGSSTTRIR